MGFAKKLTFSVLVAAAVITTTWNEGGYGDHVVAWTSIFAGIALLALLYSLLGRHTSTRGKQKPSTPPDLKPWLPAAIFAVIVLASLANVTHEQATLAERVTPHGGEEKMLLAEGLRAKDTSPAFLPGTMFRAFTGQQIQLHLSILLIAFTLWMLLTRRSAFWILTLLVINGLVLALAGIYYHFNDNSLLLGRFDPVNPSYFSAFRYHNHWSAFSLLTVTAGLGLAAFPGLKKVPRIAVRTLVGISWLAFLFAATLAQSRSLVLLLFGVFGLAVLQLLRMILSRRKTGRRGKRAMILGACFLILTGTGALVVGQKILKGRAGDTSSLLQSWKEGQTPMRLLLARDTLKLVAAKPLWGWGLGCYRIAFTAAAGPEFRSDERQHETAFNGRLIKTHFAHNDWLQYWSEIGTPAMFCLIATPWMLLRESRRSGRRNATSYWCFGGCALILVLALWDFPLSNPAILLLTTVVFMIGVKLRITLADEAPTKKNSVASSRTGKFHSSQTGSATEERRETNSRTGAARERSITNSEPKLAKQCGESLYPCGFRLE